MEQPIALFDSGLGGLTVLMELRKLLPSENYLYLGDTGRTPYGPKTVSTIKRYARESEAFLLRHDPKLLIVACNTVSSVALDDIKESASCPVIGTIDGACRAALSATKTGNVGVIGTSATIRSGAYERALRSINSEVNVHTASCPLFVPLVEEGFFTGSIVEESIEYYLKPFKDKNIDALILGCTHYPLLSSAIRDFLGEGVAVVECSREIAKEASSILGDRAISGGNGSLTCFVTDGVDKFHTLLGLVMDTSASISLVDLETSS